MTLQEIFIQNLKFYRKQKGLTQNELTLRIDKSYNYINGVEQKKSFPSPDVIERIANTLDIQPYLLFMENGCHENAMAFNADDYIDKITTTLCQRLKEDICREVQEAFGKHKN
ncbi:MAG: helix-turn-helix transcriptional regulator [Treponema sp.]|nr:helix-turn-helix transcriptional regulator [Treponema sp.]